jgi:hypothetical protein
MYADTPWLGRSGLLESPTTAIVLERFNKSVMGSEWGNVVRLYCNQTALAETSFGPGLTDEICH